jgi:ribosomal protein L18
MKEKRAKSIKKIRAKSCSNNEILVFKSGRHFYAQLIQDKITIFAVSTLEFRKLSKKINFLNKNYLMQLGKLFANKYLDNNKISEKPFFNKTNYKYGQNLSAFYESFLSNIIV